MTEISAIIVAFITGVVGPTALLFIKSKLDKNKKPDIVSDALKTSELIVHKLEDIKEMINCDRIWITQFHNGGHFYPTGKSITKFSMIYELTNSGVSSVQQTLQNIPVNLFSRSLNALAEGDIIEIPDFKDESIATFGLKHISTDNGCKSSYLFAIKSIDDKFIGVLGIDFVKRKTVLDVVNINNIMVHASSIGGVLMGQH